MNWSSYEFLAHIADFLEEIKYDTKILNFEAHFPITECYECKINNFSINHPDCLGNGRYCSVNTNNLLIFNIILKLNKGGGDFIKFYFYIYFCIGGS